MKKCFVVFTPGLQLIGAWILALSGTLPAMASGFRCDSPHGQLRIQIYNHTHFSTGGTRGAAVMVLSNPKVPRNQRTIARMTSDEGLLVYDQGTFTGYLDLRHNSVRKSPHAFVGDFPRSSIRSIAVTPDFSYSAPLENNDPVKARFVMTLKNGDVIRGVIQCRRYLKRPRSEPPIEECSRQLELDF